MNEIAKAASELGKLGGAKTLKKHGTTHFSRIGKIGGKRKALFHRQAVDKKRIEV